MAEREKAKGKIADEKELMKGQRLRELLEKQQYGFVGKHSAVKICTWTKKSIKNEDYCYKQKFYGIRSHLCCQMSPSVGHCHNRCIFCWRPIEESSKVYFDESSEIDSPDSIIAGCIEQQKRLLTGFFGNPKADQEKLKEAMEPMHFAISLTGEPMLYPKINELIKRLHKLGKTTFVVTNGLEPERLKNIEPPTQLYLSVDAPNKELFEKIDQPTIAGAWERLMQSLRVIRELNSRTRTCLRLTLIKGKNMVDEKGWASAIMLAEPLFVELKAYMFVGFSRLRLKLENMPRHNEVRAFAEKVAKECSYKIIDEKKESRVVLLAKRDFKGRIMNF